ncbi:hypothetical protein ACHQM5_001587 [Ranunculus cassubicifolius]
MAKIHGSKYMLTLLVLVLINLLFLHHLAQENWQVNWSRGAAIEAESVASIPCSGHGRAYLDGVPFEGKPKCECNTCFSGKDCSVYSTDCSADADR